MVFPLEAPRLIFHEPYNLTAGIIGALNPSHSLVFLLLLFGMFDFPFLPIPLFES